MEKVNKRPSIFWPLLLIAAGVAFLLANFGYIEADLWYTISRLWPLFFIVGSLDSLWKGEEFAGSLVMLAFGGVLLAASLGYLQLGAFELLVRLWPVFIIAIALNIIFGRAPIWAAFIGGLFGIALIAGVFFYSTLQQRPAAAGDVEVISQELGSAQRVEMDLDMDVADVYVTGGLTGSQLVRGEMSLRRNQQADQDYEVSGQTGTYSLRTSGTQNVWPLMGLGRQNAWTLELNSEVPLDLESHISVGDLDVDLTDMQVSTFSARADVGTVDVTLPAEGALEGNIRSAVGAITLRVPEGAAVEIQIDRGITAVSIPDGFVRHGDMIYSPGAESGGADMRLRLEQPIGEINIRNE